MDHRDRINALLTQMGMRMEDLSADCILAPGIDDRDLDVLINRCGRTIAELSDLLAKVRTARDATPR